MAYAEIDLLYLGHFQRRLQNSEALAIQKLCIPLPIHQCLTSVRPVFQVFYEC